MSIRIRDQRDDDPVAEVVTAAFGDDGTVARLAEALLQRDDPGASLVAVEASAGVVGHVQLSTSWVDAPSRLVQVLVLSPLSVAPAWHRQGIATRLLAAAVDRAQDLGAPMVFLEGSPAFYGARGWRAAEPLGFTRPSVRIPSAAFQIWPLPAYDAAVMSGALVYNDTFWTFDCVGLR